MFARPTLDATVFSKHHNDSYVTCLIGLRWQPVVWSLFFANPRAQRQIGHLAGPSSHRG
jgi:hypothetical protein